MPQPNAQNAPVTAAEFLSRCFAPGETIALFLRREVPRTTLQRVVQLETALAPRSRYRHLYVHQIRVLSANTWFDQLASDRALTGSVQWA